MPDHDAHPPAAPPTIPGPTGLQARRPNWPTLLGVILIAWASLASAGKLLEMLLGHVQVVDSSPMIVIESQSASGYVHITNVEITHGTAFAQQLTSGWRTAFLVLQLVAGLLLMPAAIGVLKRRRWGVTLAWVWIGVKIPLEVLILAVKYQMGEGEDLFYVFGMLAVVSDVLWALGPPVVLLIWFSWPGIRKETAGWR